MSWARATKRKELSVFRSGGKAMWKVEVTVVPGMVTSLAKEAAVSTTRRISSME